MAFCNFNLVSSHLEIFHSLKEIVSLHNNCNGNILSFAVLFLFLDVKIYFEKKK